MFYLSFRVPTAGFGDLTWVWSLIDHWRRLCRSNVTPVSVVPASARTHASFRLECTSSWERLAASTTCCAVAP